MSDYWKRKLGGIIGRKSIQERLDDFEGQLKSLVPVEKMRIGKDWPAFHSILQRLRESTLQEMSGTNLSDKEMSRINHRLELITDIYQEIDRDVAESKRVFATVQKLKEQENERRKRQDR